MRSWLWADGREFAVRVFGERLNCAIPSLNRQVWQVLSGMPIHQHRTVCAGIIDYEFMVRTAIGVLLRSPRSRLCLPLSGAGAPRSPTYSRRLGVVHGSPAWFPPLTPARTRQHLSKLDMDRAVVRYLVVTGRIACEEVYAFRLVVPQELRLHSRYPTTV